jgi:hypothetical protein
MTELASDAFIHGFPLVFDLQQVDRFAKQGIGSVPATAFNVFGHATRGSQRASGRSEADADNLWAGPARARARRA